MIPVSTDFLPIDSKPIYHKKDHSSTSIYQHLLMYLSTSRLPHLSRLYHLLMIRLMHLGTLCGILTSRMGHYWCPTSHCLIYQTPHHYPARIHLRARITTLVPSSTQIPTSWMKTGCISGWGQTSTLIYMTLGHLVCQQAMDSLNLPLHTLHDMYLPSLTILLLLPLPV